MMLSTVLMIETVSFLKFKFARTMEYNANIYFVVFSVTSTLCQGFALPTISFSEGTVYYLCIFPLRAIMSFNEAYHCIFTNC